MQLEKFYVDVVSTDGSGCIGYAVRLDGLGLAATIAATLAWRGESASPAIQCRTIHGELPTVDTRGLAWRCAPLEVDGGWQALEQSGAEHVLWREAAGAVRWQMLAPRARVELRVAGATIAGYGYAERLRLDLAPWRLPIDGLRWGRFVAAEHSVVWIEWQHAQPRRWLWHNGRETTAFTIGDAGIGWSDGAIRLGEPRTLRSGRLAETVLARWPGVQRWLPRQIQAFDESKWCAPATLVEAGGASTPGWVIHERVRFR